MKNNLILIWIALLFWSCQDVQEPSKTRIPLSDNWTFKAQEDKGWQEATVPGVVHLDLLNLSLIDDPYVGIKEDSLQWIGQKTWEYLCEFKSTDFKDDKNIDLVFDGLDTYANVYFNDSLILMADNMYRTWRLPIKPLLKEHNNAIRIEFLPAEQINQERLEKNPQKLPDYRAFTRKAPYHFAWDWGPKFITAGIWKSVYIETWGNAKINQVQLIQDSLKTEKAFLSANIQIENLEKAAYQCVIKDVKSNKILAQQNINSNKAAIAFEIEHPKLWWTHDLGEANLYEISVVLMKDGILIDSQNQTIGLRTIELVQENDAAGRSFYFKLNGKTLFIKGANYIPNDNFLPRVSKKDYEEVIASAVWANMNMLRVWGGGIYESDYFYNLCDQNGILVWQDFMFACAMYPGDSAFLENVKQEAIDNVIRLRHHPSIALWCGNNEIDNGWKDWGWQKQLGYSKEDSLAVWSDYQKLFHQLLPNVINTYDKDRSYWPSSPEFGWGHDENMNYGDSHYWGVWWGFEPFDIFNQKVPRFMSEYGFQALPNYKTIEAFTDPSERFMVSKTLQAHQKHARGFETIHHYLRNNYKSPESLEDYTYISQLLQAEGMKIAIEAHRRNQPHCMGTLYWQLNDCWPVCSWSSIDYFKRKKASHYFVKEAYKPIILSTQTENNQLDVYAISNAQESKDLSLIVEQYSFEGKLLNQTEQAFQLSTNNSIIAQSFDLSKFQEQTKFYLYIKLLEADSVIDEDYYYSGKIKDLALPKAELKIESSKDRGEYKIILSSSVLTKNIELVSNIEGEFSENYFDLNANIKKSIYFYPKEEGVLKIKYRCINNLY
jgi:beta-mannosidase